MNTKWIKKIIFPALFLSLCVNSKAFAVPTLQVYIEGATAGTSGSDEDTWFSGVSPFTLYAVGAYASNTINIENVTLVVSVPDASSGTLTVGSLSPTVLGSVNEDLLTDIAGAEGYDKKEDFFPAGLSFNDHYPFKNEVSDFLIYDLGSFGNSELVRNYSTEEGISEPTADGEVKKYIVSSSGFTSIHFDLYALVTEEHGGVKRTTYVSSWDINPASHDATSNPPGTPVPEPATWLMTIVGSLFVIGLRRFNKI